MNDVEAVALATRELEGIGLIDPSCVVDGIKVLVPKAYPMYDSNYEEAVHTIRTYLASFDNLHPCGRNGLHRYNNQDHSMWTAVLASLNALDGTQHDVWEVNTDEDSRGGEPSRGAIRIAPFRRPSLTRPPGACVRRPACRQPATTAAAVAVRECVTCRSTPPAACAAPRRRATRT